MGLVWRWLAGYDASLVSSCVIKNIRKTPRVLPHKAPFLSRQHGPRQPRHVSPGATKRQPGPRHDDLRAKWSGHHEQPPRPRQGPRQFSLVISGHVTHPGPKPPISLREIWQNWAGPKPPISLRWSSFRLQLQWSPTRFKSFRGKQDVAGGWDGRFHMNYWAEAHRDGSFGRAHGRLGSSRRRRRCGVSVVIVGLVWLVLSGR